VSKKVNAGRVAGFLWVALLFGWSHAALPQNAGSHSEEDVARSALAACRVHKVTSLPGSGEFASDFIETMARDPASPVGSPTVWALTADLSSKVPASERAMYISRSQDGGTVWTEVAKIDPRYFDADLGEGERNGLGVFPGGNEFVLTTQRGAFQIILTPHHPTPDIRPIPGPRVIAPDLTVTIPKKPGDSVTANVVKITPDGKRLIIGYGYFDLHPQLRTYRRQRDGSWSPDKPLPTLPTEMDLLSMEFGDRRTSNRNSLYVGTGDQAFLLRARSRSWKQLEGVGDDSAVQGISTVGGPHLAACWGVYNPTSLDSVVRVTHASFLLHRNEDEAGSSIRAFSVEVDPIRPSHQVVTSLTGVYVSQDHGWHWRRLNDLPDGEFRLGTFNPVDGTVIASGIQGTYLSNPFTKTCSARLKTRDQ
jgi:hypothetical protein